MPTAATHGIPAEKKNKKPQNTEANLHTFHFCLKHTTSFHYSLNDELV